MFIANIMFAITFDALCREIQKKLEPLANIWTRMVLILRKFWFWKQSYSFAVDILIGLFSWISTSSFCVFNVIRLWLHALERNSNRKQLKRELIGRPAPNTGSRYVSKLETTRKGFISQLTAKVDRPTKKQHHQKTLISKTTTTETQEDTGETWNHLLRIAKHRTTTGRKQLTVVFGCACMQLLKHRQKRKNKKVSFFRWLRGGQDREGR